MNDIMYHAAPASRTTSILHTGIQLKPCPFHAMYSYMGNVAYLTETIVEAKRYACRAYEKRLSNAKSWCIFEVINIDSTSHHIFPDYDWNIVGIYYTIVPIPANYVQQVEMYTMQPMYGMKRTAVKESIRGTVAVGRVCLVCGELIDGIKPVGDTKIYRLNKGEKIVSNKSEVIGDAYYYNNVLGYAHINCINHTAHKYWEM